MALRLLSQSETINSITTGGFLVGKTLLFYFVNYSWGVGGDGGCKCYFLVDLCCRS